MSIGILGTAHNSNAQELYRRPHCTVTVSKDICYGSAYGYWSSMTGVEQNIGKAISKGIPKSIIKREIDLCLDLYQPEGVSENRPLILFIHGGAFYFGSKEENAYVDFCNHFASMGYVAASINYRLGFHFIKKDIEQAEKNALEDSYHALKFLIDNSDEYHIDKNRIFLAGSSSGAITALKLVALSNTSLEDYRILAVANLWGAVYDLSILEGINTSIISFHGDKDVTVPLTEGYPMSKSGRKGLSALYSDKMYGSESIDQKAEELGLRHRIFVFEGKGHALNKDKDNQVNDNQTIIKEKITEFFYEEVK